MDERNTRRKIFIALANRRDLFLYAEKNAPDFFVGRMEGWCSAVIDVAESSKKNGDGGNTYFLAVT